MNPRNLTMTLVAAAIAGTAGLAQAHDTIMGSNARNNAPACTDAANTTPAGCVPSPALPDTLPDSHPGDESPSSPSAARTRLELDGGPAGGALITPAPRDSGATRFDATGAPILPPAPSQGRNPLR